MVFQIQKVSNYGTSTPAVARTFYQGCEILGFFAVSDEMREQAKIVLLELQRHLLRCVEIRDQIEGELVLAHEAIRDKGFEFESSSRVITLPSVSDIQSKAESFLQSAKLAIRETAQLVKPFYGESLDHRFNKFAAWAEKQFGPNDSFTEAVKRWEPWVKRIVHLRNAVDHPRDEPGEKLITQNLRLGGTPREPTLTDPTWGLSGEPQSRILKDMSDLIEGIIELGEEVLIGLFYKLKHNFPLAVYEIPVEQRDSSCPIRFRVGIASTTPKA